MSSDEIATDPVRDQAARWAQRLNETDLSDIEREKLHRWLLADPRHATEFRAHNAMIALAHELPADLRARLSAFVPNRANGAIEPGRRRWAWPAALAAAILLALSAGGWLFLERGQVISQSYATGTGQTRTVTFVDGSVAYLNTRTRLKWIGTLSDRRVAMLEGEALFDVAHDPQRPFHVLLDNSEIRVLGTRFNVYRKIDGETVVTVLEGMVDVHEHGRAGGTPAWQRRLGANQQIVYRPLGLLRDVRETRAAKAVKWREGVMEIQDEPLPQVLEELNRYTDHRIVIRDPVLNQMRVVGVLNVRDVRAALARLEKLAPVTVTEGDGSFTLAYQTPN